MKKYRVPATMLTYLYLEVSAESAEEALAIAKKTDGAEFLAEDNSGGWELGEPVLERDPHQDYLKDKQKKWWGHDKHKSRRS